MITVVKPASGAAPAKMATTHPNALTEVLLTFKKEFIVVGIFSAVVNLLMLTPTLYLLQVFDRVLNGQSVTTLLVVSLITLFLFAMMAFA